MPSSNRLLKSSTRCAMKRCKDSTPWRNGGGAARQWAGGEWHDQLRCALGLHSLWPWSRPLRSAHSCTARLYIPLHPWLTIRCVCTVCDRRRLHLLQWSQDRRADTARRCGSRLYTGLDAAECFGPSRALKSRRAASIPCVSWWHRCTAVATSCSSGLSGQ